MKKQLVLYTLLGIFALTITSCKKDKPEFKVDQPTIENIEVPDQFDWKTTKDYSIVFSTPTIGLVEVSNIAGLPYQKAFLVPDKTFTMKLTVPSYDQKVIIKHNGQTRELDLSTSTIYVNF